MPTFEDFSSEQLLEDVITAALEYEGDFKSKFLEMLEEAAENPVMLDLLRDIADGVYIEYTPGIEEELAKINITIDQLGEILNEVMASVGQKTIDSIGFDIQFDMTSPEAIDYAGRMSARLVTNVGQAIKDSIRDVVQEVLRNDMTLSQMRRFVKQRVGLLPSHSRAVTNLYNNLISTSGPQTAAKRANEYANRLRNYRADMITRTEIATAQSYGQLATWQQFLRDRVIPPDSVRIWMTAQDERVCEFCGPMHLATAPVDGEWVVPLQSGGMGSVNVPTDIHPNCRCASGLTFPVGRMNEFLSKHGVSGFEIWNLKKHYKGTKFDHDQGSHAGTRRKEPNVANATATGFAPVWKALLEHTDAVKFINEKYNGKFDIPDMDDVYSVKFRGDPSAGELAKEALAEVIGEAILEQMTPAELQEAYQQFALLTKDIGSLGTLQLDEIVSPHYTSHLDILELLGPDKTWSLAEYGVDRLEPDRIAALVNLMKEAGIKPGGFSSNPGAYQDNVVLVWPEDLSGNIQLLDPITMDELANVSALPRSSDSILDGMYRKAAYSALLRQANRLTVKQTVDAFRSNPELLQEFNDAGFRIKRTMHETNTVSIDMDRSADPHTLEPGVHKAIAAGIVNSWAISSKSIGSRLLGRAVISEFGASNKLDPDDTTERAISNRQASGEIDSLEKLFRIVAVRQYEMTQRALKAAGITHIDLVRGMSIDQPVKGVRESEMRALSSWSTEMKTTRSFAGWLGDGQPTYVSARFPIERIFATPLTGIGCFHEAEFVVLGVPGTDNVFFIPESEIEELKYYGPMDGREKVIFKEMEFPEATVLGTVTKAIVKPIWIDEDIINADWIKVAGVDLPGVKTAEDYIEYYGLDTDEALAAHINEVKSLPYWVGVPSEIKDGLASVRLSKHLDGQHDQKKHGKWAKSRKSELRNQLKERARVLFHSRDRSLTRQQLIQLYGGELPFHWKTSLRQRSKEGVREKTTLDADLAAVADVLYDQVLRAIEPDELEKLIANGDVDTVLQAFVTWAVERDEFRAKWEEKIKRSEEGFTPEDPILRPLDPRRSQQNAGWRAHMDDVAKELLYKEWRKVEYGEEPDETLAELVAYEEQRSAALQEARSLGESGVRPDGTWDPWAFAGFTDEAKQKNAARDEAVAEVERAMPPLEQHITNVAVEKLTEWTGKAHQMVHISADGLLGVLDSERFFVLNEQGPELVDPIGGNNPDNQNLRLNKEYELFGTNPLEVDGRPVYGYLHDNPYGIVPLEAAGEWVYGAADSAIATRYGDISVRLKPEVRSRSTWALDDTFAPSAAASKIGEADEETVAQYALWAFTAESLGDHDSFQSNSPNTVFDARWPVPRYIETQVHGGIKASDIEAIVVPNWVIPTIYSGTTSDYDRQANSIWLGIVSQANRLGIPIEVVDGDGDGYVYEGTEDEKYIGNIGKHADHDQKTHGNWARKGRYSFGPEAPSVYTDEAKANWKAAYEWLQDNSPAWWDTDMLAEDGLPAKFDSIDWSTEGISDLLDELPQDVSAGLMTISTSLRKAARQHVQEAISLNEISPEEATRRWKYKAEAGSGGTEWQELPDTLYHASAYVSEIVESGRLLSRGDAGGRQGLGGGSSDTISFTTDKEVAKGIVQALKEVHYALNLSNEDMAANTKRAAGPWWDDVKENFGSLTGNKTGVPTNLQERYELYRVFATVREYKEGVLYPLFFNVDPKVLQSFDPNNIGYVTVRPALEGAKGYQVSALGEWRIPTGKAVEIVDSTISKHAEHNQDDHGNWAKSYTGHPALDDVIASFLDSPLSWDEQCKIGNTSAADIAGYCAVIADEFTAYAKERLPEGWSVYTTHTNIEEMGYTPSGDPSGYVLDENGNEVLGFYFEHAVNSVYPPGARFPIEIDFTAKQYGYDTPVLIHKSINKHAQHNQDDHGNWARGGNRYPYDKQFIRDSSFVASQFGSDLPTSKDVMEAMFSGADPVTSEELDAAVHQLSFELAYAGEPYVNFSFDYWSADSEQDIAQAVVEAVNQDWANDVSDPGPIFYSQLAAETISELTGIKFDTRHLTEEQVKEYSDIVNNPEKAKAVSFFRKMAIAQYKLTQQMFERSGITHLQVWRGVSVKKDSPLLSNQSDGKPFLQAEIEDRALSSWSTNYIIAKRFGWINSPSYKQLIMHQIVPVEFVFSMAGQRGGTTTLGAALEDEVVLFGGFGEVNVFVDWKTYDETRVRDILTGKKVFEKIPSKVVSGSGDPLMQWGLVDKANKLKKPKIDLTDDKNANWIKSLAERDQ